MSVILTPIGPAVVAAGDPTVANGGGMKVNASTQNVGIDLGLRKAYVSDAARSGVAKSGQGYVLTPQPQIQAQFNDLADLETIAPGVTKVEPGTDANDAAPAQGALDSYKLGDSFEQIDAADELVVCVIPQTQIALGVDGMCFWMFCQGVETLDGIQFGEIAPGRIQQPYNTSFMGCYRSVDHKGDTVPVGARVAFWGPPSRHGLSWSLPPLATLIG